MKLLDLVLQNFMSFGPTPQKLVLHDAGLVAIEGENLDDVSTSSNGAAKSALIDGVSWTLYGVTTHEPSAEGDDVVNRFTGKNCIGCLRFKTPAGVFTVTRGRAVEGKRRVMFGSKPNGLRLEQTNNGTTRTLTLATMKDTQQLLNRILGMSAATFRHAVVFGQSKAFRFSRLSDAEKKSVIDEMVGAEVYATAAELASQQAKDVEHGLEEARSDVKRYKEALEASTVRLMELARKQREQTTARVVATHEATEELERLAQKLAKLVVARNAWADAPKRLEAAKNALHEVDTDSTDIDREHTTVRSLVAHLSRQVRAINKEAERLRSLGTGDCPTCLQPVTTKHVARVTKELRDKAQALDYNELQPAVEEEERTQRKYDRAASRLRSADVAVAKAERAVAKLRNIDSDIRVAESKLQHARKRLNEVREERFDFADLMGKEEHTGRKLGVRLAEATDLVETYEAELLQLRFWQEGFSARGLRSLMLDSVLPFLNTKLQQYSSAITSGNIQVEMRTQRELKGGGKREELHVAVTNTHGASSYKMLSIGERTKVDLIVGLALQDMAASRSRVPVNVAFFDEPFDGLDATAMARVADLLVDVLKKRESVFIITHEPALKAYISKVVKVVKENNISRIES